MSKELEMINNIAIDIANTIPVSIKYKQKIKIQILKMVSIGIKTNRINEGFELELEKLINNEN